MHPEHKRRYDRTEKGRARHRRYNTSPAGRARAERHTASLARRQYETLRFASDRVERARAASAALG